MKIKSTISGSGQEGTTVLIPGQWTMIYASFFYNLKTLNAASVVINGASTDSSTHASPGYYSYIFSDSDVIKIGAGFIGQLRRLQVYSPASYLLDYGSIALYESFLKFIKSSL